MSKLNSIYNFVQISEQLATSGQPSGEAFQDIAAAGYQLVINLAPSDVSHALPDEGDIVEAAGMTYLQIPVDWGKPKLEDWQAFVEAMDANRDKKVFVHCIANMRVSAFVMLYRSIKLGIEPEEARAPMLKIWNPEERHPYWLDFIEDVFSKEKA